MGCWIMPRFLARPPVLHPCVGDQLGAYCSQVHELLDEGKHLDNARVFDLAYTAGSPKYARVPSRARLVFVSLLTVIQSLKVEGSTKACKGFCLAHTLCGSRCCLRLGVTCPQGLTDRLMCGRRTPLRCATAVRHVVF